MSTSRGYPPQLRLSIPPNTTSFKRSFEQFGFDLDDSPTHNNVGSDSLSQNGANGVRVFHQQGSLVGMGPSGSAATSSRHDNDRNKRARSSSSRPIAILGESSRRASSSTTQSSSSLSAASSSSIPTPPLNSPRRPGLELPPRLPTPDIDVDMPDVDADVGLNFSILNIPSATNTFAPPAPTPGVTGPTSDAPNLPPAGPSGIDLPEPYRLTLQGLIEESSAPSPPVLPPLHLETEEQERDPFTLALPGTHEQAVAEEAPEPERLDGDLPPRIHIDLPQSSLTTLVAPEPEQEANEEAEETPVTLPFSPHPPTLPPIPTTDLLIAGHDDAEPRAATVPPQSLDDHVPPSPSLHELRRWIDDAASPAAQSDDSSSGLARSDVADPGTSRVVSNGSISESRAPPPPFAPEPESWHEFLSLSERISDRLDVSTDGIRQASVAVPRIEPTSSSSATSTTSGVEHWFPIPRRRRRPLSSALGSWDFDLDDGEPVVPRNPPSNAADSSSNQALPGLGGRPSRTMSLASHLTNRGLRRRLSLFEDEDDGTEGDHDEVVASPTSVRAVAPPPRYSAAPPAPSVSSGATPQWFRPLEVDLGPRHESSSEQSEARPQQQNRVPSLIHRITVESSEDGSSSDESDTPTLPLSTPFTFSSTARLSLAGASSSGPSSSVPRVYASSSQPGSHRHYHSHQVTFRSSSSRLVDSSSTRDARERDLRIQVLGSSTPSTSVSTSGGDRVQSDLRRPPHLSDLVTDRTWLSADRESTTSSVGATAGSSTEDVRMQVDDDVVESPLPIVEPLSSTSPLTDVSSRYPNASRFLTSLSSSPAASSTSMGERPPSSIYQPPRSRTLAEYERIRGTGVGASSSVTGPGHPNRTSFTATTTSSFLPVPALPSPNFDLSFTHDTTSTSTSHYTGGVNTAEERTSNNSLETPGLLPPPLEPVLQQEEQRRPLSPGLVDFLRDSEGGGPLDTGFFDEHFRPERDRQRDFSWELLTDYDVFPSPRMTRNQPLRPGHQQQQQQQPQLPPRPLSLHSAMRTEVPRSDLSTTELRSSRLHSNSTAMARGYGADVEMDSNEASNVPYPGRLPSYHSDLRSSYRSSYMGPSSTGPSTASSSLQPQQSVTARPGPTTSNTNTDTRNGQDGGIASRFIPGPYRNTLRALEMQRNVNTSEEARATREQARPRFHNAYLPFRSSGESGTAVPPRPPSPAPVLPPQSFDYRPPTRPSRPTSFFDYLSGRSRSRNPESSSLFSSSSSTMNPSPPETVSEARTRTLFSRMGGSSDSNGPRGAIPPRPPVMPHPPSPESPLGFGYDDIGYRPTVYPSIYPAPPTPGLASAVSAPRRFEASEQSRPFTQAIEALREPSTSTSTSSSSGSSSAASSMESLRRRLMAATGGFEDSGLADSSYASGRQSTRNANRRARTFSSEARPGRRLFGFSMGDFMRDEDFDNSYEGLLSLSSIVGEAKPRGTPSSVLDSMEKAKYRDWANDDSDKRCPICLDDYNPSDPVMKLNHCSHWLHQDCLNQWLQSANTCPVCRKKVITSPSLRPEPGPSRARSFLSRRMPRRLDLTSGSNSNANGSAPANNNTNGGNAGPSSTSPSEPRPGPQSRLRNPELGFLARERLRRRGPGSGGGSPPS